MRAPVFVPIALAALMATAATAVAQPDARPRAETDDGGGRASELTLESGFRWTLFFDTSIVSYGRDVRFGDTPDNNSGASTPHFGLGVGVWFDNGLGDLVDRFGVRLGYVTGGDFRFGGTPDLASAAEDDFHNEIIELGFLTAWDEYTPRPSLVYRRWEFFGAAPSALRFRGATIPAGAKYRQGVEAYGVAYPITVIDDLDWAIRDQTPTLLGMTLTYSFFQVEVETLVGVGGTVPNHMAMIGAFVDWGIAAWLRWSVHVDAGMILGRSDGFIANVRSALEFVHVPSYWFGNTVELLMRFDAESTTTDLGDRYIVDPAAPASDSGQVSWINFSFRLGLRVWF